MMLYQKCITKATNTLKIVSRNKGKALQGYSTTGSLASINHLTGLDSLDVKAIQAVLFV